jgi:hypothetical protein
MYNEKILHYTRSAHFGFWEAAVKVSDFSSLVKGKEELVHIEYEIKKGVRLAIRLTPSKVSLYRVLPLWVAIERGVDMYVFLSSLTIHKFLQGPTESFCRYKLQSLKKEGKGYSYPTIDYIINGAGEAISVKK